MKLTIKMTNQETGQFVYVFDKIADSKSAIAITRRLNEVNQEVAKFSGNAVKFFYSIVIR